jgi:hypothetical protein
VDEPIAERQIGKVEQRRAPRYPVVVPVEVKWEEDGKVIKEAARARDVSAHGGLLEMKIFPWAGSQLKLTNLISDEAVQARVVGARRTKEGGVCSVAVELLSPSESFWGINFQLKRAGEELARLEHLMKGGNVDPRILREFRDSVDYVRKTAWAVQEWTERQLQHHDTRTLLPLIIVERIRRSTQLSRSILADFAAHQVTRETAGIEDFHREIASLHQHMVKLFGERGG